MKKIKPPIDMLQAHELLLEALKQTPQKDRKQLVEECMGYIELSPKELKDKRPGAMLNKVKCMLGNAI